MRVHTTVRIVGGTLRGQRLVVPKGDGVRPTPERVREALFNILGQSVVGARVLDLYSGTGALGIEALSRGADFVCFVEQNRVTAAVLRNTLERFGLRETTRIVLGDVVDVLPKLTGERFDLVVMDPPYGKGYVPRVLTLFESLGLIAEFGTVVCETGSTEFVPKGAVGTLTFGEQRVYGDTALAFYDQVESSKDRS